MNLIMAFVKLKLRESRCYMMIKSATTGPEINYVCHVITIVIFIYNWKAFDDWEREQTCLLCVMHVGAITGARRTTAGWRRGWRGRRMTREWWSRRTKGGTCIPRPTRTLIRPKLHLKLASFGRSIFDIYLCIIYIILVTCNVTIC